MLALAGFLARLLPAFGTYFMLGFRMWHLAAFAAGITAAVIFLDKILLVLGTIGAFILKILLAVVARFLLYLISKLPGIPENLPDTAWNAFFTQIAFIGRYVDLNLVLTYMGIAFSVYAGIYVYKLAKFIRGGG